MSNITVSTIRQTWFKRGVLQFQTVGTLTVRSRSAHGQVTVREIILTHLFKPNVALNSRGPQTCATNSCEEYLTQNKSHHRHIFPRDVF